MNLSLPEKEEHNNNDPENTEATSQSFNSIDLSDDPDFSKLIDHYQRAEFDKCNEVLTILEKRHPDHPRLSKFKDDLQLQLSLKTMAVSNKKAQTHKKRKITFKMSVFAVISTILVMVIYFIAYNYIQNDVRAEQLEKETAQLTSLNEQVEQLLLAGQPRPAAEIIESIFSINPEYALLPDLTSKTENLLRLEANYNTALNLVVEKKSNDALIILKEIEAEKPGLWDVSQRIASIETSLQIAKYMEQGDAAYRNGNWDQVFSFYDKALTLDPKFNDPQMNEQMFKGYLNKILSMLQDEGTSVEEIDKAEQYYRQAVAMILQGKANASEKGDLQEVSSNLIASRYAQTAKAMLEDKSQTVTTVAEAVSYLQKAANLKPDRTALQSELQKAQAYQNGFQNFIDMDWVSAITNFTQLLDIDPTYANGNASLLLFEAYYSLGKQYYSVGLFEDARKNLEQAELLAWNDTENLLKLFQVQVLLGDTIGMMGQFKDAGSYYDYALDAIQIYTRLGAYPALYNKLVEAERWYQYQYYEPAFPKYKEFFKGIADIYTITDVEIGDSVCLAFFASENLSTMEAIIEENNLPMSMVVTIGRNLKVPAIKK